MANIYEAKHLTGQRVVIENDDGLEIIRFNPKAFADADDAMNLAEALAKFMTQMRMWQGVI